MSALPTRRVRVRISAETFEATLGTYGGRTFLGLRKAVLTALGVAAGDSVRVELEPGAAVEEPTPEPAPVTCPELEAALTQDADLARAWASLPEVHHDEYGRWIAAGSEPQARATRIARLRHRLTAPDHGAGTPSQRAADRPTQPVGRTSKEWFWAMALSVDGSGGSPGAQPG